MATLTRAVEVSGVGLHSGLRVTARLVPAQQPGVRFVRIDLPGAPRLVPSLSAVSRTVHATTLSENEVEVGTAEHLLAALWAGGVDCCEVELDGPEVPILDGSALPWCHLIQETGLQATSRLRIVYGFKYPVWICDGQSSMLGLPDDRLRVTTAVDYPEIVDGRQVFDLRVDAASFQRELAPARTFAMESWLEPLRSQGLIRGGSAGNAVVFGPAGASSPPRLPDELARHKALDLVGNLSLLCVAEGAELRAHIIAVRGGHGLHRGWMEQCQAQRALEQISGEV